jgi:hypothetical protein
MSLVTSTNFRRALLSWAQPTIKTLWLRLYVNNYVPLATSRYSSFAQPTGVWYAPVKLAMWGPPYVNSNNQGEIDEVIHNYVVGSVFVNESVYGYWVSDPNGNLCWAERDPSAPVPMNFAGAPYSVRPRLLCGVLC